MIKIISRKKYNELLDHIDDIELDNKTLIEDNENYFSQVKVLNADNKAKTKELEKLSATNVELGNLLEISEAKNEITIKNNKELRKEIKSLREILELRDKEIEELKKNVRKSYAKTKKEIQNVEIVAEELTKEVKKPKKATKKVK